MVLHRPIESTPIFGVYSYTVTAADNASGAAPLGQAISTKVMVTVP
jgi:hypothetical protein